MKIPADQRIAFERDRTGCVIGRDLANKFKLNVGDRMALTGDIFPGDYVFTIRGIFDSDALDVIGIDGQSVITDQKTFIDIRAAEFTSAGHSIPEQGDIISIPAVDDLDDEGDWEVISSTNNGGGEVTIVIRKLVTPAP